MQIKIFAESFDPWQEMLTYRQTQEDLAGKFGATNVFIGCMRDFNEGDDVSSMVLEHYPEMTERQLNTIVAESIKQWPVLDALVVHRVGEIYPEQPIVLVAVWTSHRGDAFDASRYIMEALKSRAPFWKKERLVNDTERWVEKNTDGYKNSTTSDT